MAIVSEFSSGMTTVAEFLRGASTLTTLVYLAEVLAFWYILSVVYLVIFHPLSKVPGPLLAKCSSKWLDFQAAQLQKASAIHAAHEKYGPIVRIGPNEISFVHPGLLNAVYGNNMPFEKTAFYEGGHLSEEHSLFSLRNKNAHAGRRKLMSRNFGQSILTDFTPQLLQKTQTLVHKLDQLSDRPVDVYPWLHRLGFEIIYMQIFGRDPHLIDNGADHPVLKDADAFLVTFVLTAVLPLLRKYGTMLPLKSLRNAFLLQKTWLDYICKVMAEERQKLPKERSPWINQMMQNPDTYLGRTLTDLQIAEEIVGVLFAGSGTTANTLAFLIYAVAKDREVYRKLKAELEREIGGDRGRLLTLAEVSRLQKGPYLNAVILEALRRYPTIPGTMPRAVICSRFKIGAYEVPRGTIVGAQNFSVHMNKDYFPDPETFNPERFLGDGKGKAREGMNPFSEGPRACIGRNLAMLEMQIVVAMFFRDFDVEVDKSMTVGDMKMKEGFSGCPAGEKVVLNLRKSQCSQ